MIPPPSSRRVDIRKILRDPVQRAKLMKQWYESMMRFMAAERGHDSYTD